MTRFSIWNVWQPVYWPGEEKAEIFLKKKVKKQILKEQRQKSKFTSQQERTIKGF